MNGIILADKPGNITSAKFVNKIKSLVRVSKAGHTGTLDPFATGLLTICLEKATRIIPFINENTKEYEAVLKLGEKTDTLDFTGKVIMKNNDIEVGIEDIKETVDRYHGFIEQEPPDYSAVRVNGERLYKLARKGIKVNKPKRKIYIDNIQILDYYYPFLKLFIRCSKGTFVRSIADSIGEELGAYAHLTELRRVKSGNFSVDQAFSLDDIERGKFSIISLEESLHDLSVINIDEVLTKIIRNGVKLNKSILNDCDMTDINRGSIYKFMFGSELICIAESLVSSIDLDLIEGKENIFKFLRVFH